MKKKVLIKWIIGCGMLCMMLLVLWKRTHINYDEYSDKTSDMQHEEVEEISFPDHINEKVSDGLVFDAEVVIGENFDPDNFYVSTARIMKPDEEKWKQFFGVDNTWDYNVYETESRIGDKIEFQTYTDKQENTLYLTSEEALWAKQDMVFIYNVLDTNEYSPQNNGKLFSEKMDLSFESRQDNLRTVLDKMQQIGIDAAELEVHQEYDLNVDKLKEQEEKKIEAGDIEQSEKKESWSTSDEAYYYYLDETTQGLPVFSKRSVNDYAGDDRSQIIVCAGNDGIRYLYMKWFFLFDIGDGKVKFAPIDNIKECIKTKYGKTLDENCITVKKMVLGVYPLAIDKEKNAVIPVWICFLERKTKGSEYVEKLYVPINAITGEEFYDMEG